jgi:hypothetical protein
MPGYSKCKALIQDLQFLLITTFANTETAKRKYQITPPCIQTTIILLGFLGLLSKTEAQPEGLILLLGLLLAWH